MANEEGAIIPQKSISKPEESEKYAFFEIGLAIDLIEILVFIYEHHFRKKHGGAIRANYAEIQDSSSISSPDESDITNMVAEIAELHLAEIGIPLDCDLHFFNDKNEVVLSRGDNIPKERINAGNVMGIYKPGTHTAYVRVAPIPAMVSTIAHEVAHHFLTSQTTLGNFMKDMDAVYEVHKVGSNLAVETIIGDVRRDYGLLFRMSNVTHEGFASWVGHYVLKRFVETAKERILSEAGNGVDVDALKMLIAGYDDLAQNLDNRAPEYYYGRLEYCGIEETFGCSCVPLAAQVSMNVEYDVAELPQIWNVHGQLAGGDTEVLARNFGSLKTSPNLRLLAISRLLPGMVRSGDDISKFDDHNYMLNAIRRYLGDNFLEIRIDGEDAKIAVDQPEEVGLNPVGIAFGELLAEMAYGEGDVRSLVNEFSSISGQELAAEMAGYLEISGSKMVKKKAAEILDKMRLTDMNVKVGDAIYRLGFVQKKEDILEVLHTLRKYSSDASRLYDMVSRDEFKGAWPRYLKELQMELKRR